jgi:hypothetical protein
MDILTWRTRMETALEELRDIDLGYPQDENVLGPPAGPAALAEFASRAGLDPRSPLVDFYRACSGVSLPDVHVGYFIHEPGLVLRGLEGGEPRRLTGPYARAVVVFGTDGGGGRFALGADGDGEVLYLGEGAVHDAVFDDADGQVQTLAPDLPAFLERLLADVEAFVNDEEGWEFMV